jgi:uncharacterized membrane protein YfbV (UPF0208 family)
MESPIATTFTRAFEPAEPKHVIWWKMLCDELQKQGDPLRVVKKNPMNIMFQEKDIMDLVFIQFSIGLKYATATLEGKSWSPAKADTP